MKHRDIRIDILRGIAMLTILLNHIAIPLGSLYSYDWPTIPTLTQFGYSSAASLFVAMSGYMVGMVYMKKSSPSKAVLRRALQLYTTSLVILAIIVAFAYLFPPSLDRYWHLRPIVQPPFLQLLKFVFLLDAPAFLDIFQLYVTLLLVTPIAIVLYRRSPALLAACSIGLWAVMQLAGLVYTPDTVLLSNGHSLNVLAWQMTFFLPMIAGTMKLHQQIFAWLEQRPRVVLWIWVLLAVGAVARALAIERFVPLSYQLTNRPLNSPVWIGHSLLVLAGYAGLLVWLTPHLERWPFQKLASLGRNSLNVFATSIPLIYLISLAFGWLDWGFGGYLLGVAALLCASFAIAAWGDQKKQRKQQPVPPIVAAQSAGG